MQLSLPMTFSPRHRRFDGFSPPNGQAKARLYKELKANFHE